jgi:hypothetical protein
MIQHVLSSMNERAKELSCLYELDEVLKNRLWPVEKVLKSVVAIIPRGWQHTTLCEVRLSHLGKVFQSPDFEKTAWIMSSDILVDEQVEGRIEVVYTQIIETEGKHIFLPQEQKLLNAISDRLGHYFFSRRLRHAIKMLQTSPEPDLVDAPPDLIERPNDNPSEWRHKMASLLASQLDTERFAVVAMYLIGSSRDRTAGPGSDLDLLIHFEGTHQQNELLRTWLEGWSLCLAEVNFHRTGIRIEGGLLDIHLISSDDIEKKTSFAIMIGKNAEGLPLGT